MADISNEIKNFREAVYGEEVRGSMISLAEKLNEVSEATEQAEKKRVTAETGRVSAEKKRQMDTAAAIERNDTATERANTAASAAETATEETNRATENANTKAALADAAAKKAETAAKSANDAAGSVEAAKTAALEAAELATAEAGKATTAASNANSKASAANTAAGKANTAADRAEKAAEHAEGLVLGDISEKTVTFEMASERAGVQSGDSLAVAFGKLAKYCTDLKPHVFVDPVNNLLGTDATLPLAATQGKALDEKIEGVKTEVDELNGKTEKLQAHELCIPGDTTNVPPNNKFLNISLKDRFNAVNRCHYFRQPNGTEFEGCPSVLKGKEFIGYREIYWYSPINVMVQLREFYPMPGRVWTNFHNNGTWTGWKSITPV